MTTTTREGTTSVTDTTHRANPDRTSPAPSTNDSEGGRFPRHRPSPGAGMKPFTATTRATLDRLTELGLAPTDKDQWNHPTPTMSVEFGRGSGWMWGDLVISTSGRLSDFRVHWHDRDGVEYFARYSSPTEIREQVERHAAQRLQRIACLAQRHGLTVTHPTAPHDTGSGEGTGG